VHVPERGRPAPDGCINGAPACTAGPPPTPSGLRISGTVQATLMGGITERGLVAGEGMIGGGPEARWGKLARRGGWRVLRLVVVPACMPGPRGLRGRRAQWKLAEAVLAGCRAARNLEADPLGRAARSAVAIARCGPDLK
jgi:hypothetical protein